SMNPETPLRALARQLRDERDGLNAFEGDDEFTNVRAVFSWSYRLIGPEAARLFRLLGLHPGPDVSIAAAASLAAIPTSQARARLSELVDAHLIAEPAPNRYAFHDLLRAYAGELAELHDAEADRQAATRRLLDHCLRSAIAAERFLNPSRDSLPVPDCEPGVVVASPAAYQEALEWFRAEHQVLQAIVGHAAAAGFDVHAWKLAWTMNTFLNNQGHWHDWVANHEVALEAARRLSDRSAQAYLHIEQSQALAELGRLAEGDAHLDEALALCVELDDLAGQGQVYVKLGRRMGQEDRPDEALAYNLRALELFKAAGHKGRTTSALNNAGWYYAKLGEYEQALHCCEQALAGYRELGDDHGQGITLDSLGYIHHGLDDCRQAAACYREAIAHFRGFGARWAEASSLSKLADVHRDLGDLDEAQACCRQALDILDELNHSDAAGVRAKLHSLSNTPGKASA
ncbi:MAG: tetratricopeptide repeat protein, partial [Stackebrandtia sp.]